VKPLGLYLHVPFCSAICNYCNFNRGLLDPALKARYVRGIEAEIRSGGWRPNPAEDGFHGPGAPADTIYFGGGTPSLLEPGEIGALIDACRDVFQVAADAEVTLEANPETVSVERLSAYRSAGVNRVSFGVQSFRDEELRRLGRIHDARRAAHAVREARAAGFDNISLDLMLWLPAQTTAHVQESLAALIDLGPEHASLYLLELYPNAPLREDMARAGWSLAPDEVAAEMYLQAMASLETAGYEQYEISNVARPGRRSIHNMKYWTDGEWVGFGCGAHSTVDHVRWNNVSSTVEYLERISSGRSLVAERRPLSPRQQLEEALFMGLRLVDGVSTAGLRATYGIDVWATWGRGLERYVDAGLLVHQGGSLRLTREGMLLSNEVLTAFLEGGSTVK
jgi:oxygen-independent coproporphyrinogen III oxidase